MGKYFYCYNKAVSDYLKSKGIHYINVAIEPKSKKLYSLYEQNNKLEMALKEYRKVK